MLASPSSPLFAAGPAAPVAAGGDATAPGTDAAPGFAELLSGLTDQPSKAPACLPPEMEQEIDLEAAALVTALAAAVGVEQPASGIQTATATGKDLPAGLPEAAETDAAPETAADPGLAALTGNPLILVIAPGLSTQLSAPSAAAPRVRSAGPAAPGPAAPAVQTLAQAADKPKSDTATPDNPQVSSVAITVAAPAARSADTSESARPALLRAKPAHSVEAARSDAPFAPLAAAVPSASPADPVATAARPHAANPAPAPAAADIGAALDRLAAAREALMPAHAALAIDHADFGEVSIRFEQSADGRLSAELAAADPGLQRAVTAAVAADRGSAAGSDSDGGRAAQLAGHRGSAAGGDAAPGERGQSAGDRHTPERRSPARPQARQATADPRPGIFA